MLMNNRQPIAAEPCTDPPAEPLRVYIPDPFDEPEDWRLAAAATGLGLALVLALLALLVGAT